jgi:hypothetical protein
MKVYVEKTFGNAATPVPIKINVAMDGLGMTANDIFDIMEYSMSRFLALHQAMIKYHDGDEAIFDEGDEGVAVTYRDEFALPVATGLTWEVRVSSTSILIVSCLMCWMHCRISSVH